MLKTIILSLILVFAATPSYALTSKQKQQQKRQYAHRVHQESQLLKRWMGTTEKICKSHKGDQFYSCYVNTLRSIRARNNNVKFSSETDKIFNSLTTNKHKR